MLLVKCFQVIKTWYLVSCEKPRASFGRSPEQLSVPMSRSGGVAPSRVSKALLACPEAPCGVCAMLRMKILHCLWLLALPGKGSGWYRGQKPFSVG